MDKDCYICGNNKPNNMLFVYVCGTCLINIFGFLPKVRHPLDVVRDWADSIKGENNE